MNWFLSKFRKLLFLDKLKRYKVEHHEELPLHLKKKVLYVLGEKDNPWSAALLCPCGCKDKIHLSLLPDDHPSWKIRSLKKGDVSLQPSVWRKKGCKSHFFFKSNTIEWCE